MRDGMRLLAVMALVALVCLSTVHARFSAQLEDVQADVFTNESATYRVLIRNFEPVADTFQVSTIDPQWIVTSSPFPLMVGPGGNTSALVYLKPKSGLEIGYHGPPLKIKSLGTGEVMSTNALIYLKPMGSLHGRYQPSVAVEARHVVEVDPREGLFDVTVFLRNRNPLEIEEALLSVRSVLFSEEVVVEVGPLESKTRKFSFSLDPLQAPGEYEIFTRLTALNTSVADEESVVRVLPFEDVRISEQRTSSFFRYESVYTIRNAGNAEQATRLVVEAGFFKRLFSSASLDPVRFRNETGSFWVWEVVVPSDDEQVVEVVTDYRILALLLILAVFGSAAYFMFRSPIVVIKEAVAKSQGEEGVSEVRVVLYLRNRSARMVKEIAVLDQLPSIAEYVPVKSALGTLQPTKVSRQEERGTLLKWDVEYLDPYEERVIVYRLKSRLRVTGGLTLPAAKVRFQTRKGAERVSYSNAVATKER
ncbi:MAG: hypothetical protein HC945_02760 [Nitrosarchaeum sp.]|nr:hypothetical protein [Nitrosarchaeum sp.]